MGKPFLEWLKGEDGQFYLHLKAVNGKILLASEAYTRAWSVRRAAKSVSRRFGGLEIRKGP